VTAFIGAEIQEFIGLRRHLKNERCFKSRSRWAVAGELNGNKVVLAANGPGPNLAVQAAKAMEEHQRLNALVSYGFCGALDPALAVNDIVVGSEVKCEVNVHGCAIPRRHEGMPPLQKLLSVDRVVGTAQEKAELHEFGAAVTEMEAAGLAAYAHERHMPFYCIRVVTDSATEDLPIDFNTVRDSDGRFSRFKIISQAARDPVKLIPALMNLNKRANAAARHLGDFVATCEF
jgi:adenosylhomocysteine nucleosidase